MKKIAYVFGIIGFFAIFILCAFEEILMSVNSYGLDTVVSLYIFFIINAIGVVLLTASYLNDRHPIIHKVSFNLNNRGVAYLYLIIPIFSVLLLINSNCYNLNTSDPVLLTLGFFESPELYLPIIPVLVSAVLFVLNSSHTIQKLPHKKKVRVSHI